MAPCSSNWWRLACEPLMPFPSLVSLMGYSRTALAVEKHFLPVDRAMTGLFGLLLYAFSYERVVYLGMRILWLPLAVWSTGRKRLHSDPTPS